MRDGNWPTALHSIAAARMAAFIGPRLKSEIKPAIEDVAVREHRWGLYLALSLIASLILIYLAYQTWPPLGHLTLALGAIVNFKVFSIFRDKENALNAARRALDGVVNAGLFGVNRAEVDLESLDNPLPIFDAAGFFGAYDKIRHIESFGPVEKISDEPQSYDNPDLNMPPQMVQARMTRTEVEHYTDSQGRRQTRTRTVEVFDGILLTLDVPCPFDDSRILISSRRTSRPRGIFERTHIVAGKKRRHKLEKVKVSSPRFNKLFKILGDDQMETHEFLDPDRVMRFLNLVDDLEQMFGRGGRKLSLLITRGKAYFAIETGKLGHTDGFRGRAEEMATQIETVAAQLALPHIIADHLKLTPPPRYEWDKDVLSKETKESLA